MLENSRLLVVFVFRKLNLEAGNKGSMPASL
ncbi:MAG: hypothetical protein ACJA1P_000221 [Maribacter sp.]|jgi:hypothetical protein